MKAFGVPQENLSSVSVNQLDIIDIGRFYSTPRRIYWCSMHLRPPSEKWLSLTEYLLRTLIL